MRTYSVVNLLQSFCGGTGVVHLTAPEVRRIIKEIDEDSVSLHQLKNIILDRCTHRDSDGNLDVRDILGLVIICRGCGEKLSG